jgi:PAS domain S-box-containing protein
MKRYFIYGYIIIVSSMNLLYYQYYLYEKQQKQLVLDSSMYYDFEMAKEFLNSKLRSIYFHYLDSFVMKKTFDSINHGNEHSIPLLQTLYYQKYHENKQLLKDIVFYDKEGKFILSINNNKNRNLNLIQYTNLIKNNQIFIEYKNNVNNIIKINALVFQGSIVGYVQQVVSLATFVEKFLPQYLLTPVDISNKKADIGKKLIVMPAIDQKDIHFILEPLSVNIELEQLRSNLLINITFSSVVLLFIFYILYFSFKKEQYLKDEIKQQKEFFRKLVNTSPNPIFVKDIHGKYLLANNATAKLFDIKDQQLMINKTNKDLNVDSKLIRILDQEKQRSLTTKELVYKEFQKVGEKYFKFVHVPIFDYLYPSNQEMVIGYATDITSEVEKKNELANLNTQLKIDINDEMLNRFKINEKFRKIFNNIHNAMFVCKIGDDGQLSDFVDVNSSGKIFLKRFSQFETKTPHDIFDGFKFQYNHELDRFEVTKYSYILKIPHGRDYITFQMSCNIIFINNDFHAVIFVQLIDDILKLKKEKKEKQVLLENIFKKAKSGIAVIDRVGHIRRFNRSFYETIGANKDYFYHNNFFSLFDTSIFDTIKKEHEELFMNNKEFSQEYIFKVKNNQVNVIASSTLIEDSNDEYLRLFIFEDITKQKQLEQEQYQNSRIIAQQAKMAEMGEMIGAIAHQWRQPLNAINAAAIRLNFTASLDLIDSQEIQEKTKFIEKQSLKMSETINDFMYFFTPSKNKQTFHFSIIYQKIFDFLEPQLKNREIQMSLDNPDDMVIYGFQNEFEHILLNLINNAKDAFEDVSESSVKSIQIIAQEQDEINTIQVIDNAGGIPNNILNKIFNPYFTTKEEGKGTGIGLYMTKTIIDKHFKGSIEVSNNDNGAVFTLNIPKEHNG